MSTEQDASIDSDDATENQHSEKQPGRITRPTTVEIRHESMRLNRSPNLSEFDAGVKAALEWVLGDRRTLIKLIKK